VPKFAPADAPALAATELVITGRDAAASLLPIALAAGWTAACPQADSMSAKAANIPSNRVIFPV